MITKEKLLESNSWMYVSSKNPVLATRILYRIAMGKRLNLDQPRTLNEKMQWLKLYVYRNNKKVEMCADKYEVREYLKNKGCESILNELYGVWKEPDSISWDKLPDRFVIKCTHGSGYNIIVNDKRSIDINNIKELLNKWIHETYGRKYCELIYDRIQPRIIAEKFIDTVDGKAPTDYKFFCTYGKPKFLYVMQGNDEIQDYYTAEWEWLPVRSAGRPNSRDSLKKPELFDEMLKYASILSEDFPLARIDFYNEQNKVIFGEITFLTTGGFTKYDPEEYDIKFGEMFPDITSVNNSKVVDS